MSLSDDDKAWITDVFATFGHKLDQTTETAQTAMRHVLRLDKEVFPSKTPPPLPPFPVPTNINGEAPPTIITHPPLITRAKASEGGLAALEAKVDRIMASQGVSLESAPWVSRTWTYAKSRKGRENLVSLVILFLSIIAAASGHAPPQIQLPLQDSAPAR